MSKMYQRADGAFTVGPGGPVIAAHSFNPTRQIAADAYHSRRAARLLAQVAPAPADVLPATTPGPGPFYQRDNWFYNGIAWYPLASTPPALVAAAVPLPTTYWLGDAVSRATDAWLAGPGRSKLTPGPLAVFRRLFHHE